jgi:hypothetical protein
MEQATAMTRPRAEWWSLAASSVLLAAFGAFAPRLLRLLANLPDDDASVDGSIRFLGMAALGALAALSAVLAVTFAVPFPELQRLQRFTRWVIIAGLIFWFLPTPFWVGRMITYALLAGLAAAYLLCVVRTGVSIARRRGPGVWTAPIAACGCVFALTLLPLLIAYTNLGWQRGID